MNSNLFERKQFLDESWMTKNISKYFSVNNATKNFIVKVNLERATASEADYFKFKLSKIPTNTQKSTIIDLSNCNFVDSTFLSSIIKFNKTSTSEVKLVVADARQLAIFKITKLDSLFKIYSSLEQATVD